MIFIHGHLKTIFKKFILSPFVETNSEHGKITLKPKP